MSESSLASAIRALQIQVSGLAGCHLSTEGQGIAYRNVAHWLDALLVVRGHPAADRDTDHQGLMLMLTQGGNFAKHLAQTAIAADAVNYAKLREAFTELFDHFNHEAKRTQ